MPKIHINEKEVEVKEGTRLIDAFLENKEDIAHYCYHPGLSVAGVCRLCVCEIEGNPRPQIACNTIVQDGMKVTNQSENVKQNIKWVLDFHLINHPLDCPICDQAGECGLQNQYMKFGQYDPEMGEKKVKKRKAVDLGSKIVLDTERCILCSRCVRFTDEITKTEELGIFNRGDRSEVGTFQDKPLDNKYSVNTVDICPVGALTSKDFRFQQRVWYLKDKTTTCPGCSTGCSVNVYYNDKAYFRIKPEYDKDVNSYWMCDEGRSLYKHVNKESRLLKAVKNNGSEKEYIDAGKAAKEVSKLLSKSDKSKIAIVVCGQYTNEEYSDMLNVLVSSLSLTQVYHWKNNESSWSDFDGLLIRGDKNPNTLGLQAVLKEKGLIEDWSSLENKLSSGEIENLLVIGPEIQSLYTDIKEKAQLFRQAKKLIWFTANPNEDIEFADYLIPAKTFVEKTGTYTNYNKQERSIQKMHMVVSQALTLSELSYLLSGKELPFKGES